MVKVLGSVFFLNVFVIGSLGTNGIVEIGIETSTIWF
jgi:hypothetical protein